MPTEEINDGMDRAFRHSELVVALLDTPEAQRTSYIINNGVCYKAFPGIRYTRHVHLMDCAKRAEQVFAALQANDSNLPDSYRLVLLALAVTHDLGHPPFAHALRKIIEATVGKKHETVSAEVVKGDLSFVEYFSKFPHLLGDEKFAKDALRRYESLETVPDILERHAIPRDLLINVLDPGLAGKPLHDQNIFVRELIDGSLIDIDKMAYLPRDSRMANIAEAHADPGRILTGLRVINRDGKRVIAVSDTTLDDLCMWGSVRKYMYADVYTHKTVLKYEAMLTEAVKRSLPHFQEHGIEIHLLTDEQLLNQLTRYDEISAQLVMDFMFNRHRKYAEAFKIRSESVCEEEGGTEAYRDLRSVTDWVSVKKRKSKDEKFDEDHVRKEILKIANRPEAKGPNIKEHEVLVYLPYDFKTRDKWMKKFDIHVYSHRNSSDIWHIRDMIEDRGPKKQSYNGKAVSVFEALCRPQTSVYFAVYSSQEHRKRVNEAAKEFFRQIRKAA